MLTVLRVTALLAIGASAVRTETPAVDYRPAHRLLEGGGAVPAISSLAPSAVAAGSAGFQLVVNGSQFDLMSQVRWNGSPRQTTFVSPTRVLAAITPPDVAAPGTAQITVASSATGGGTSNVMSLAIVNPIPTVASVSPAVAPVHGDDFALTVFGTGFTPASIVRLNGAQRPTTFLSSTRLLGRVLSSDLAAPGIAAITVMNPAPGGGTSLVDTLRIELLTPTIASLSPNVRLMNSGGVSVRVNGSNFVHGSVVRWNGSDRPTNFVSSSQVDAAILTSDIAQHGSANVTVATVIPNVGSRVSGAARFDVASPMPDDNGLPSPIPVFRYEPVQMTFRGGRFMPQMIVRVNGVARPTTVVDSATVRVRFDSVDVANAVQLTIRMENPAPTIGPALSSLVVLNPPPVASSITPTTASVGGQAFTLTVKGSRFVPESKVYANGSVRTTTFVSRSELRATIPASDLTQGGDMNITVASPTPGGGTSTALRLTRLFQKVVVP